jgi:hypothetical protein
MKLGLFDLDLAVMANGRLATDHSPSSALDHKVKPVVLDRG